MEPSKEEELLKLVMWPNDPKPTYAEMRAALDRCRRFIDYDNTIVERRGMPFTTLCGKPLAEFLAEEPFIVQTWNHHGAIEFFTALRPDLPQPVMIVGVPSFSFRGADGYPDIGKDFTIFDVTGKEIIDDFLDHELRAPGCTVVHP